MELAVQCPARQQVGGMTDTPPDSDPDTSARRTVVGVAA